MNFEIVKENFYQEINPYITTERNGIVYFNALNNDNEYPQSLVDRYINSSSIHSNFINLKRRLTYASGLLPEQAEDQAVIQFINKQNNFGDDLNDIFLKVCLDYALLESGAVQVIYNAAGKIAQVVHTDMSRLRAEEADENGIINAYWYSKDWGSVNGRYSLGDGRRKEKQAVRIPIFDPSKYKQEPRQIYIMKRYTTGNPVYPIPSYNSTLNAIDADFELSRFNLNQIKNGFLPSAIISMIGQPSPEEKQKFINKFNESQTGTANVKALFMFLDSMDNKPTFERMSAPTDAAVFDSLKDQITQDIATGHGASLELAGVQTGGADLGGDANKLAIARLTFIENVIKDFQRVLLKGFNNIMRHNDLNEVTVVNEPLKIEQPVGQPDDLTRDERREMIYGLPPLDEDNTQETVNE